MTITNGEESDWARTDTSFDKHMYRLSSPSTIVVSFNVWDPAWPTAAIVSGGHTEDPPVELRLLRALKKHRHAIVGSGAEDEH